MNDKKERLELGTHPTGGQVFKATRQQGIMTVETFVLVIITARSNVTYTCLMLNVAVPVAESITDGN